jgi:mannose-6-phosphate isomerase-like protein (cupin superfamily)
MPAELFRRRQRTADSKTACSFIIPAPAEGWPQLALGEWELRGGEFGDRHPHDEVNYVLDGRLIVECDGERVEAGPGDVVRVPAGHAAYYSAPGYARMLFIYGPNPRGAPAETLPPRQRNPQ